MDLRYGYHQIRTHLNTIGKTTFCTYESHYEFLVMSVSLSSSLTTIRSIMDSIQLFENSIHNSLDGG